MQPAHRAHRSRDRVVVLYEININSKIQKCFPVPAFGKESSFITEPARLQQQHAGQFGFRDLQNAGSPIKPPLASCTKRRLGCHRHSRERTVNTVALPLSYRRDTDAMPPGYRTEFCPVNQCFGPSRRQSLTNIFRSRLQNVSAGPSSLMRIDSVISSPQSDIQRPGMKWNVMPGSSTVSSSARRLMVRSPQSGG